MVYQATNAETGEAVETRSVNPPKSKRLLKTEKSPAKAAQPLLEDMERATKSTAEVKEIKSQRSFSNAMWFVSVHDATSRRSVKATHCVCRTHSLKFAEQKAVTVFGTACALGPYDKKRAAESDKNRLKRIKIVDCGIWGWT